MAQTTSSTVNQPHRRQLGFSMVEVLVSVFIVAIGLLGIAGLQFMSKRSNFEAVQRTTATLLASDIVERMRANPTQLIEYGGSAGAPIPSLGGPTPTRTAPGADCSVDPCTAFELSQHDLWQWETALNGMSDGGGAGGLTAPTACLSTDVAAGVSDRSGNYTVAIAWRGSTQLANPVAPDAAAPDADAFTCGEGSGKYNGEDGSIDTHRRVLVVTTYVSAN
jgi:type IV pilus assembly protein PilV